MKKSMKDTNDDSEILIAVDILMGLLNSNQTTRKSSYTKKTSKSSYTKKTSNSSSNKIVETTSSKKIVESSIYEYEKTGESSNSNNLDKYSTKTIYEYDKPSDNKDIIDIIQTMFPEFVKKDISLSEMLKVIENNTGYTIQKVVENENIPANIIHEAFKTAVTKNLIFLYNQRNIQYYPIILYYNNILQKYITGKSPLKIIQVYRDV
jgi:hypothetical protein